MSDIQGTIVFGGLFGQSAKLCNAKADFAFCVPPQYSRDKAECDQLAGNEVVKVRRNCKPEKLAALREAFIASRDPNRKQENLF